MRRAARDAIRQRRKRLLSRLLAEYTRSERIIAPPRFREKASLRTDKQPSRYTRLALLPISDFITIPDIKSTNPLPRCLKKSQPNIPTRNESLPIIPFSGLDDQVSFRLLEFGRE